MGENMVILSVVSAYYYLFFIGCGLEIDFMQPNFKNPFLKFCETWIFNCWIACMMGLAFYIEIFGFFKKFLRNLGRSL